MAGHAGSEKKAGVFHREREQSKALTEVVQEKVDLGIVKGGLADMAAKDTQKRHEEEIGASCAILEAARVENEASKASFRGAKPSYNTGGHCTIRNSATRALPCMPGWFRHSQVVHAGRKHLVPWSVPDSQLSGRKKPCSTSQDSTKSRSLRTGLFKVVTNPEKCMS